MTSDYAEPSPKNAKPSPKNDTLLLRTPHQSKKLTVEHEVDENDKRLRQAIDKPSAKDDTLLLRTTHQSKKPTVEHEVDEKELRQPITKG